MTVDIIIVAAGSGARSGTPLPKAYRHVAGASLLEHSIQRMRAHPRVRHIVVVAAKEHASFHSHLSTAADLICVEGGVSRANSVRNGLTALRADAPDLVLIHDAARAFMPTLIVDTLLTALETHRGAIPVLVIPDSLKQVSSGEVADDLDRNQMMAAQTPQAFHYADILGAYEQAGDLSVYTDDVAVARGAGLTVAAVPGHADGFKLTYPDDFDRAERLFGQITTRVGSGFDVHRFGPGDHLWLCGIKVPHTHGLIGHSDADVALHAATDAVLGAMALGDIGQHFPPSDPQWKGVSSDRFLRHAIEWAHRNGGKIINLDITIICEAPKIGPHREAMRARLAEITGLDISAVSVKATTTEGLGLTGRREGIAAQAIATVATHK